MKKSRMLLPEGFVELRRDMGETVRKHRLNYEYEGLSLQEMAALLGISRETLSRIENGRRWPSYKTIDNITRLLGIEWDEIATTGEGERPSRFYATEYIHALGAALHKGRYSEGLTLKDLAEKTGISQSQLSRIERAQISRSRVLKKVAVNDDPDCEDPEYKFIDPELARLAQKGGFPL